MATKKPVKKAAAKKAPAKKPAKKTPAKRPAAGKTATAPKKKGAFPPPRITLGRGDLELAAVSPDGTRLLLLDDQARGLLTLITEGERIYEPVRLATGSGLFPPPPPGSATDQIVGFAMVPHEGRTVILATWRDDSKDGPGYGAFELDGKAITVTWLFEEERRRKRAKTKSSSGGSGDPTPLGLALSPDGSHVAVAMADGVLVWPTASFIAGKPPAVAVKQRFEGLVFDREGRRVGGRNDDRDHILFWDVDSGAASKVKLEPVEDDYGRAFFGGHGIYVSGGGVVRDERGKVIGRLPDQAKAGAPIGGALFAVGDSMKNRCVYRIDPASGKVAGKVKAPDAHAAIAGREGEFIVVGGPRHTALTLPWP